MATFKTLFVSVARQALPLAAGCLAVLLLYPQALRDLRVPDPPKARTWELDFFGDTAPPDLAMRREGFASSEQGLSLAPGRRGVCTWRIDKRRGQGCLLRVWLYGSALQPAALSVSLDGGATFTELLGPGNHRGTVIDPGRRVRDAGALVFRISAENHAPYTALVSDRVAIFLGAGGAVAPALPDMIMPLAVFLCVYAGVFSLIGRPAGPPALARRWLFCGIVFVAFYLRWHELVRLAGTPVCPDAQGYFTFARAMDLFGPRGFYSADFGLREPLYPLAAKALMAVLTPSVTHLRMVSCLFSMLAVVLTWLCGKKWLDDTAGLLGAAVMAVQPYLIELSARGLREEFFTCLVLLLLIALRLHRPAPSPARIAAAGCLAGALILTRLETAAMTGGVLLCAVLLARPRWPWPAALVAACIGLGLVAPHLYAAHHRHGSAFYAVNAHTRFYANIEFAGRPGFPSRADLRREGMYIGPPITPLEYYFTHHTVPELLWKSAVGFVKTTTALPRSFAEGKGMLRGVTAWLDCQLESPGWSSCRTYLRCLSGLTAADIADYVAAAVLSLSLIAGIAVMIFRGHWFFCGCLLTLQAHLSLIASLGIDQRLGAHVYPVIALCCAAGLRQMAAALMRLVRQRSATAGS